MDKRSFIRMSLAGSTLGIVAPKAVFAGGMESVLRSKLAGHVYSTEEHLGRWSKGVAAHHLPHLEKQMMSGSMHVHVATNHPMVGIDHFIVKHEILNHNLQFMQDHIYKPTKDKTPATTFNVGSYHGPLYVVTICNIHDMWVNMIEV